MTRFDRQLPALVGVAVLVATASCGGASDDDDGAATTPPVVSTFTSTTEAATTTVPPADDGFGALGILTLRPVITCEPRSRADDSLDQDVLPMLDGDGDCVVGPSTGTGAVF